MDSADELDEREHKKEFLYLQTPTRKSVSLLNISATESEIESISFIKRKKKNKYDHVQSKVKEYREKIKEEKRQSKVKKMKEKPPEPEILVVEKDMTELIKENLKYKQIIEELDLQVKIQCEKELELMNQISEKDFSLEKVRGELWQLQEEMRKCSGTKMQENSVMSMLRTPLRTFSKSLLTPYNSLRKRKFIVNPEDSNSSDEDDVKAESSNNNKVTKCSSQGVGNCGSPNVSIAFENKPLINNGKKRNKFFKRLLCFP